MRETTMARQAKAKKAKSPVANKVEKTVKNKDEPSGNGKSLDVSALESWLWDAACAIRGPVDAPKYKDYILPLIFLKRLSDVFDDEIKHLAEEYGSAQVAQNLVDQDHKLVRFYLPKSARWPEIAKRAAGLGEYLTDAVRAVAKSNPKLSGVIDVTDFNATQAGQRILDDDRLSSLVQVLNNPSHRLGINDVEPDILGRAYEYLLRKFAEGQGSSAGEFYTPREIGVLMAKLLSPEPGNTIYDPTCGSGGLLIKAHLELVEKYGEGSGHKKLSKKVAPLQLFGQETNHSTFAMARMNAFIHDMDANIALGNTMTRPHFLRSEGGLQQFDRITANPMWNQEFEQSVYENDPFKRFSFGIPPAGNADWGWIQHMYASLEQSGKMVVLLDSGVVTRGSGNDLSSAEKAIREKFVRNGSIRSVILLPQSLFYNTKAAGVILVIAKTAEDECKDIQFIDASSLVTVERSKNSFSLEAVEKTIECLKQRQSIDNLTGLGSIQRIESEDFNLLPTRYINYTVADDNLTLPKAFQILDTAKSRLAEEQALLYQNKSTFSEYESLDRSSEISTIKMGSIYEPTTEKAKDLGENVETVVLSITKAYGLVVQSKKFDKQVASGDRSNYKVVRRGYIVTGFPIDEGVIGVHQEDTVGLVSPAYSVYRPLSGNQVDYLLLHNILRSPQMLLLLGSLSSKVVERRRAVAPKDFLNVEIRLPVGEVLNSIRKTLHQIEAHRKAIEAYNSAAEDFYQSAFHYLINHPVIPSRAEGEVCP